MVFGKIVSILLLPAAAFLFSATLPTAHPLVPITKHASASPVSVPKMSVENSQVFRGQTIVLRFQTPHPQYLGVIDPDGKFFYIVFPAEMAIGKLKPLIDSQLFSNLNRLEIATSRIKADPYTYGILENKPVFTKSGVYEFILGDNLHVDDPTAMYRVKVNYIHKISPVQPLLVSK